MVRILWSLIVPLFHSSISTREVSVFQGNHQAFMRCVDWPPSSATSQCPLVSRCLPSLQPKGYVYTYINTTRHDCAVLSVSYIDFQVILMVLSNIIICHTSLQFLCLHEITQGMIRTHYGDWCCCENGNPGNPGRRYIAVPGHLFHQAKSPSKVTRIYGRIPPPPKLCALWDWSRF